MSTSISLPIAVFSEPKHQQSAERILQAALDAADPYVATQTYLSISDRGLQAGGEFIYWQDLSRILLVGAGKASLAMGCAVNDLLGDRISGGLLITKHIDEVVRRRLGNQVEVRIGAHPLPDERSVLATRRLLSVVHGLTERDLVICVISGGGSALLTDPPDSVSLAAMQQLTRSLLASGASIQEINTLRKHLDGVKGGGLARAVFPARLLTFILSDVVGSPLESIASGPTVPDGSTFQDAWDVLEKHQLIPSTPSGIIQTLQRGIRGEIPETIKAADYEGRPALNILVASNEQAAQAAVQKGIEIGWNTKLLTTSLQGEARSVGAQLASVLIDLTSKGRLAETSMLAVAGGETTVTLRGAGFGGRNLELALAAVPLLADVPDVALITLATDGEDGPTDAAGAVVTGETVGRAAQLGLNPAEFLARNDSYTFFQQAGGLIKTGPTGTNVNDLVFLIAF